MIYLDSDGFPTDSTKDSGDSSMMAGVIMLTGMKKTFPCYAYEISPGLLTRHPKQYPWNNPYNFSRDQLSCLLAGYNAKGQRKIIERVMWKTFQRFGFAQNFDRDRVGTRKYPWPHWFTNDKGVQEFCWFDFADPLLPNTWGCLILGARAWFFYWLLPVCFLFHLLSVWGSRSHAEQNQIISEVSFYRTFKFYVWVNPKWELYTHEYWYNRVEGEYAEAIIKYVRSKL